MIFSALNLQYLMKQGFLEYMDQMTDFDKFSYRNKTLYVI